MNFLFTCGGTAGHINPALAVAGRLREIVPDCGILFVGANGKMETDLVPRAGYDILTVEVTNLHRSLKPSEIAYNIKSLSNVVSATRAAKKIVQDFQPDVAIGTGGYVCYPVLKAAAQLGVPTVVHESNAVPGLTTKMLADVVDRIMVGFEESRQHYSDPGRVAVTGTPVRGAFSACSKAEAKARLGLPVDKPLVVSVWGSLGARYMNETMTDVIALACAEPAFTLIHSAGKLGYERMAAALAEKCSKDPKTCGMDVRPYIYDMPLVMDAADLVLCRAGASTLAELTCIGKPAILVPSPNVTNNHQERNARVLERAGGARVLLEGEFTAETLYAAVCELLNDPRQLSEMGANMKAAGVPDATERIAETILELAAEKKK